jgi:hypothetical protein
MFFLSPGMSFARAEVFQLFQETPFGELKQNHAHGRQKARVNADRKSDGVDDAVDEGVKTDADMGMTPMAHSFLSGFFSQTNEVRNRSCVRVVKTGSLQAKQA